MVKLGSKKEEGKMPESLHHVPRPVEVDLPFGWYEFPLFHASYAQILNHTLGDVWDEERNPPRPYARIIFNPEMKVCVEYRYFHPVIANGKPMCSASYVRLTRGFTLNKIDLRAASRWQMGAADAIEQKFSSFVAFFSHGSCSTFDFEKLSVRIGHLIDTAPDTTLLEKNKDWIFVGLPTTIHRIYKEASGFPYFDFLFNKYKDIGGLDDSPAFRVNISLLFHIYKPAVRVRKIDLFRADGKKWRTHREIINCWEGMAQTRRDAWRYLQILDEYCDMPREALVPERFRGPV